jgi:hypothetical protein
VGPLAGWWLREESLEWAAWGFERWVELGLELERRRVVVGHFRGELAVEGLWAEEGLWSARRDLERWTGGEFRRFCAEDESYEVSSLAKLLCSGL